MIDLPYGGGAQFNEYDLVDYIRASHPARDYVIIGAQKDRLVRHHKPHSLDYWLRKRSGRPNTMQAVGSIIDALVATGLFTKEDNLVCPDSGRKCKGLRLARGARATSAESSVILEYVP